MLDADLGQGDTGAGDSGETSSFLDGIQSEDLRGHESLAGFKEGKTLDDFAQAYVEMQGSQPAVPENVDAYQFELPDGSGAVLDEAGMAEFKQLALDSKLTAEQFTAVADYRMKEVAKLHQAIEASKNKAVAELKADATYGGDNYEANASLVQKLLAKYGGEEMLGEDLSALTNIGDADSLLGNKTGFFRFLVDVAKDFQEDHFETSGGGPQGDKRQRDDAGDAIFKFKDM